MQISTEQLVAAHCCVRADEGGNQHAISTEQLVAAHCCVRAEQSARSPHEPHTRRDTDGGLINEVDEPPELGRAAHVKLGELGELGLEIRDASRRTLRLGSACAR